MKKGFTLFIGCLVTVCLFAGKSNPYKPDPVVPHRLGDYKLVWNEEFNINGKPDSTVWNYENGLQRNHELQWYQKENTSCKGGALCIEGRREMFANPRYEKESNDWKKNRDIINYTSSSINTEGTHSWLYGRFEIRARIPAVKGSWPAIWTLGVDQPWPSKGEIDMMEFYQINGTPSILANAAWGTGRQYVAKWDGSNLALTHFTDKDKHWADKFHIWRMDWDKDYIRLYLDDELLNEIDLSKTINPDGFNPFHQAHYILLNLALGGDNGGDPSQTAFPIVYQIDYVRVYQK